MTDIVKAKFLEKLLKECYLCDVVDSQLEKKQELIDSLKSTVKDDKGAIDSLKDEITVMKSKNEQQVGRIKELEEKLRKSVPIEQVEGRDLEIASLKEQNEELLNKVKDLTTVTVHDEGIPSEFKELPEYEEKEPIKEVDVEPALDRSNTLFSKDEVKGIFEAAVKEDFDIQKLADNLNTRVDLIKRVLKGKTYLRFKLRDKYLENLPEEYK